MDSKLIWRLYVCTWVNRAVCAMNFLNMKLTHILQQNAEFCDIHVLRKFAHWFYNSAKFSIDYLCFCRTDRGMEQSYLYLHVGGKHANTIFWMPQIPKVILPVWATAHLQRILTVVQLCFWQRIDVCRVRWCMQMLKQSCHCVTVCQLLLISALGTSTGSRLLVCVDYPWAKVMVVLRCYPLYLVICGWSQLATWEVHGSDLGFWPLCADDRGGRLGGSKGCG